jgi:antitoxin MazE
MNAQIGKWGNSLAVRIPGIYARELGLDEGAQVELMQVDGGLLLRPRKPEYRLEELLERIKPETIHGETDWGSATGREAW